MVQVDYKPVRTVVNYRYFYNIKNNNIIES